MKPNFLDEISVDQLFYLLHDGYGLLLPHRVPLLSDWSNAWVDVELMGEIFFAYPWRITGLSGEQLIKLIQEQR